MALETEKAFYDAHLDEFRKEHRHEWVVISGTSILDFFQRFEAAALVAMQTFGEKPFLIKQVDAPVVHLPFVILPSE